MTWSQSVFLVKQNVLHCGAKLSPFSSTISWEIAAMLAKVVVVGVRRIVARGAQDLTNYAILY